MCVCVCVCACMCTCCVFFMSLILLRYYLQFIFRLCCNVWGWTTILISHWDESSVLLSQTEFTPQKPQHPHSRQKIAKKNLAWNHNLAPVSHFTYSLKKIFKKERKKKRWPWPGFPKCPASGSRGQCSDQILWWKHLLNCWTWCDQQSTCTGVN